MAKSWLELGNELAQIVFLLVGAPLIAGLHRKIRARALGETTQPLLQDYHELSRLLQKDSAIHEGASVFSAVAPFGLLGLAVFAAALTPLFSPTPIGGLGGDLFVLFGLWIASKAWLSLATIESTSTNSFSAGRSLSLFVMSLPTFLLCWFVVLEPIGSAPYFVEPTDAGTPPQYSISLPQVLALFAFGMFLSLELSTRATRSALEGVFGGRLLALASYASQLWRVVWYALLSVYFVPPLLGSTTLLAAGLSVAKLLLLVVIFGFVEASLSRERFLNLHKYAAIALGLAFLANASFALGG